MRNRAFTLIELLITMAILSILASTIIILLKPAVLRNRAQDAVRKEDVAVISGALERFYADNNRYPTTVEFPAAGVAFEFNGITYLKEMMEDPESNAYIYTNPGGDTQSFSICTIIEDPPSSPNFCIENAF